MNTEQEKHIDWFIEQSRTAYNSELDLMHKLRDRVSFVTGVLVTPIAAASISLLTTYKGSYKFWENIFLFYLPLFVVVTACIISLCFVFKVLYKKNTYLLQILPPKLLTYYLEGTTNKESMYETKYAFLKSINDAITNNFQLNKLRMEGILTAQRVITLSIPFLLFSLPNYFYFFTITKPETTSVIITNLKEIKEILMSDIPETPVEQQPIVTTPSPEPLLPVPSRPSPTVEKLYDSWTPPEDNNKVLNE